MLRIIGGAALGALAWPKRASAAPSDEIEVAPGLTIRPRWTWDEAHGPTGPLMPEDVRFLLVHHTATNTDHDPDDVPAILRSSYAYHTGPDKGWPDICYNFVIDRYGTVWEGRTGSIDGPVMASATGGSQGFAQLVCLIGDFTSVPPTDSAQAALVRTLAWLGERYGIDTTPGATVEFVSRGSNLWPAGATVTASTISGHRDMSATGCPGDAFYPIVVQAIPARVTSERLAMFPLGSRATTSPSPPPTPPSTTAVPVAPPATNMPPTTGEAASTTVEPTTTSVPRPTTTSVPRTTSTQRRSTSKTSTAPASTAQTEANDGGTSVSGWVAAGAVASAVIAGGAGAVAIRQHRQANGPPD